MAYFGTSEQLQRAARVRQLLEKGQLWQDIPADQQLGDITETAQGLEPRKSDPFPRETVLMVRDMAQQGLPHEFIRRSLVDLLERGYMWPQWRMKLSDHPGPTPPRGQYEGR